MTVAVLGHSCMIRTLTNRVLLALLVGVGLLGCSTGHHRQSADTETYALIAEKYPLVPGVTEQVSIDFGSEPADLSGFAANTATFDFLGDQATSEVGARVISLEAALTLAFEHSVEYRAQKERLYLQALSLTFDRYRYTPIFAATTGREVTWEAKDRFVADMEALTGISTVETTETLSAGTSLGARLLLKSGGVLALSLTNNLTRFLAGGVGETAAAALQASFDQPLLRDFGPAVETENLIQAERNLLYQLRDFTRFRQVFAVRIASQYYSVLLARETVRNNYQGLLAVNLSLERERAFQEEGLSTLLQVGRLEQSALQQDLRWVTSLTRYKRSLDNFKILIGLHAGDLVILDDAEMTLVTETGLDTDLDIGLEDAVAMALQTRLDLYTELDRVQDASRKVRVAANALAPALDLGLRVSVPGGGENDQTELDFEDAVYRAGLDLDLPLDIKQQRNNYRRAIVDYTAATRNYQLAADQVSLTVVDAWRRMNEAERSYEINFSSVAINERRVEEAELRAELGLGDILDTVDSLNDLTAARTDLISSIVQHNIATLEFWRDVGLLYIDDTGQWEEGINERR